MAHRHAVCDELYPISVVIDIAQKEPAWSTDDYIEPLQQKANDAAIPALNLPLSDAANQQDLAWMKTDIVDKYKFVKDPTRDIWTKQPDFKGLLGTPTFVAAADRVKKFFVRNNDWDTTKNNREFRTAQSCLNLLYITAARYLFVTHILYVQSGNKLQPCVSTADKKITIPDSGVCYPAPYGSATCTSDYDVGLVGKDAGVLTEKFNAYFQGAQGFGKPSELVFDTNVYAFTLEYAMPFLFVKLPGTFAAGVEKNEQTINFKMQELASAYYKVFKYNEIFFHALVKVAETAMTAAKSKTQLDFWLKTFKAMDAKVPMRPEGALSSPKAFRTAHNNEYQKLVKAMSVAGYDPKLLGDLAKALIYAAEAYHTRGAIRHVVGVTQMKIVSLKTALTTSDLWVSMIENWGEANKEYNHCGGIPLEECFLKMTKYMWRMFNAMRLIRERLPPNVRPGLVHFGEKFRDPEFAMKMWLDYKKQGKTAIPTHKSNVEQFLQQFGCNAAVLGEPFSPTCISKMNDKVNAYNKKLAGLVTDEPVKPPWRP